MLHWPYSLNSSKQISIQNNIHSFLDDPNLDYFFTSNFLPFFCKNHPARNYHSYHDKTIEITSLSPSLVSLQGGSVVITGNDVSFIHEILLIGCEEGSMNISFERSGTILLPRPFQNPTEPAQTKGGPRVRNRPCLPSWLFWRDDSR